MRPRLKIKSELKTHDHKDFYKISIACVHEYYIKEVCPDLSFRLADASKEVLTKYQIFYKEQENTLLIGRRKTNDRNDKAFNTNIPSSLPPILVKVEVTNPRFWLVTDFNAIKKGYTPIKEEKVLIINPENSKVKFALHDLASKKVEQLSKAVNFSKNTLGILELDLHQMNRKTQEVKLALKSPAIKLRYYVTPMDTKNKRTLSKDHLQVKDILKAPQELVEVAEKPIKLSVNDEEGGYMLESKEKWLLKQENQHSNANFFKFEADADKDKVTEAKVEVFLPFPNRVHQSLFKKEGNNIIVEQKVSLLRFKAKKGPKH